MELNVIFKTKSRVAAAGATVGAMGLPGYVSKYNPSASSSAKLNLIGTFVDALLAKELAIYKADDNKTIFIQRGTEKATFDGQVLTGDVHVETALYATLVWDALYGGNDELLPLIHEMCYSFSRTGSLVAQDVFKLCDSYYYHFAKARKNIDVFAINVNDEEMKAAFRSNLFARAFSDVEGEYYTVMCAYDTGKPVAKKAKKVAPKVDFLAECKEGKYLIPYAWPEKLEKFIVKRNFLESFESTAEFEEIVKKIFFRANKILERMDMGLTGADAIGKDALNIMLLGKPGTGKTTLAYGLSAALGMPVCTTVHNKHTDEDEYEGKTKIVDGKPQFVETDCLLFHENGGIDICEEINLADPSVTMGGLGQKLEYPYIVKKNGFETIVRHPLNVVIATMNVGTSGSNVLNQALANRFKTPYILDDPTRDTFINILVKTTKKDLTLCTWVYNAYEAVKSYLCSPRVNEEDVCNNLSIRTCIGCLENIEEGQEPRRAVVNSIVGAVAVVDIELARRVQKECVASLSNPTF